MSLSASAPWVKYYGATPAHLDYPRKTMCQLVCDTAKQYPNHIAYSFMGKETNYRTFASRIDAAAKGLEKKIRKDFEALTELLQQVEWDESQALLLIRGLRRYIVEITSLR